MPEINRAAYNRVKPSMGGGGIDRLVPGTYLLYVQALRQEWDTQAGHTDGMARQCVRIVWDVAAGRFEKRYCDPYFTNASGEPRPELDFIHSCFLSWKESNLAYLKHKLNVLDACNPGFNALEALENDRWNDFVGKVFYANVDGEVDLNDRGYDRWRLSVGVWLTPDQVNSGNHPKPIIRDNRGEHAAGACGTAFGV